MCPTRKFRAYSIALKSLLAPAAVDVHNASQEPELMGIVAHIKAISRHPVIEAVSEMRPCHSPKVKILMPDNPLKQAVDEYFVDVIESGLRQSALEYLVDKALPGKLRAGFIK